MSVITMNQVRHYVNSPEVDFETVGYMNQDMRIIQTGVSQTNDRNGRRCVKFPENKTIKWHTHSHKDGFWPSFEDLHHGYQEKDLHVLFTRFGTWLFRGFGKQPDTFHHDLMYQHWFWFNLVMTNRTSQVWTEPEIMVYVNHFVNFANRIGYHVEFLPNFKSLDMNKYTQLVQNRITRLSANK